MTAHTSGDVLSPRANAIADSFEAIESEMALLRADSCATGVGDATSTLEPAIEDESAVEFVEELEIGRFCEQLECLDHCLPTCIVDYIDQLFETIYNYVAPLFVSQSPPENPELSVKNSTIFNIFDRGGGARFCLTDGNIYKICEKLDSPLDWVAKSVQIKEDAETRNEDGPFPGTYLCINLDTMKSVRVAFVAYNEKIAEETQREGPDHLITSVSRLVPASDLYSLPVLVTQGPHSYTVLGKIDVSQWPENLLIEIRDDERTKLDGSQLCFSCVHQVRVRHTLTVKPQEE